MTALIRKVFIDFIFQSSHLLIKQILKKVTIKLIGANKVAIAQTNIWSAPWSKYHFLLLQMNNPVIIQSIMISMISNPVIVISVLSIDVESNPERRSKRLLSLPIVIALENQHCCLRHQALIESREAYKLPRCKLCQRNRGHLGSR